MKAAPVPPPPGQPPRELAASNRGRPRALVLAEAHIILRLGRKLTQRVSEEQGGR
jgi:hypothetical protein